MKSHTGLSRKAVPSLYDSVLPSNKPGETSISDIKPDLSDPRFSIDDNNPIVDHRGRARSLMTVDTAPAVRAVAPIANTAMAGLSSSEASVRLSKDGPNAMPDTSAHPLRDALLKFWAPVPWLL
jgi:hypothetical protein